MNTHKKKILTGSIYFLAAILIFGVLIYLVQIANFKNLMTSIENKTFDLRQNIILPYREHNDDIVIVAVDDPSYEYIVDKFGTWPVPRAFWADVINAIETTQPKLIAFDLLFAKKLSAEAKSDAKLVDAVKKNHNVLVAMNFDNYPPEVRKAADLPDALKNTIKNDVIIKNNPNLTFLNCRKIMDELVDGTANVGIINALRDSDGVIRKIPPMFIYKGDYYKHLTFLAALKYLNADKKDFEIKNGSLIIDKNHSIPLNREGEAFLNWYGAPGTYKYVSAYQVNEAIRTNDKKFLNDNFKNKLVYVGTTTTALADVKTSPISHRHPGVEIHTTFLNNILDNSFIKRLGPEVDFNVALLLCILVGVGVLRSKSVFFTIVQTVIIFIGYFALATFLMHAFRLWIGVVIPLTFALTMFVGCYIVKYLLISRDYEHTYKLAVTDGLTNMYNHRYFQEQMIAQTNHSERYQTPYSLILIDIDFFKKFNDKYGHQSGDAVLRQVATTIKKSTRATDVACRYGGEEMSVILPNTTKEEAIVVAQKIHSSVEQGKFELANGSKTNVTISLGVASMPQDGNLPAVLIEYADKCLYKAKEHGRNQVVSQA